VAIMVFNILSLFGAIDFARAKIIHPANQTSRKLGGLVRH